MDNQFEGDCLISLAISNPKTLYKSKKIYLKI